MRTRGSRSTSLLIVLVVLLTSCVASPPAAIPPPTTTTRTEPTAIPSAIALSAPTASPTATPIPTRTPLTAGEGRHFPAGSLRLTDAQKVLTSAQVSSAYPSIAVGPGSFVVSTHPRTLVYTKAGVLLVDASTQMMFEDALPTNRGLSAIDMRVLFDQRSGRFFYVGAMQRECPPGSCTVSWVIAVSKTSEPKSLGTNDWYFYTFDGSLENGIPSGLTG